jgi:hypothetical protein
MSRKSHHYIWLSSAFLLCVPWASGATITVGALSLTADFALIGEQEIGIANLTGSAGCNAFNQACSNLAFQNWTLTVNYQSTFYNQGGGSPTLPSPYVVHWLTTADDILPGAPATFDLDLCNGADVFTCSARTTTITSIVLSGNINPASFQLFDPNANGGAGGPGATITASPGISVTLVPSSSYPGDFFESQDIGVSEQTQTSVPEPTGFWLTAACLPLLRFLRSNQKQL